MCIIDISDESKQYTIYTSLITIVNYIIAEDIFNGILVAAEWIKQIAYLWYKLNVMYNT